MHEFNSAALPESLYTLCRQISIAGGHAWLVGGCVRDLILGIQPNDFDIEVFGLQQDELKRTLIELGRTELVGRHFGVFKLWMDKLEIDVALPRSEAKSGSGHRGFDISIDPNLPPEKASLRRDFTINAMMFDPLEKKLMDFYHGIKDIENSQLRHVSDAFSEDPLRPLRAMQFAARFRLKLDKQTAKRCKTMLAEADTLSTERIWGEWQKWSHAAFPSYGLQALGDSGWLSHYPELNTMLGCPQSHRWHPEGDVWTHTLQVCDQAARIADKNKLDDNITEYLLFSSLCHDLGKPACTVSGEPGEICSPGHSEAGISPAKRFLHKIGAPERVFKFIRPLVLDHITHLHGEPTPRAVRRLSHRLEPANIELWEMLVEADASGRSPAPPSRPALAWLQQASELNHHRSSPRPIVTGKLLLKLGMSSGPDIGRNIKKAYTAQLEGAFEDERTALNWLQLQLSSDTSD
ncbi:MAG: tRNA nucleotidyltransferase [Mariprofundus sp.]|nr:tRNA nucleotidyltransferase [Mariprofundus sp.]